MSPEDVSTPSLYYVEEMVDAIGDMAGEDSLVYYLDCVHDDAECGEDHMEDIDEDDEDEDDDEEEGVIEDGVETQPIGNKNRKASTKSGKSGKSKKGKSRKNTEDKVEAEVKVPSEPNKEECKQN